MDVAEAPILVTIRNGQAERTARGCVAPRAGWAPTIPVLGMPPPRLDSVLSDGLA